jgi:hypothetical protein
MLSAQADRPAAEKELRQRGGVWTLGEVLAELMPHYGLPPLAAAELPAPIALVISAPTGAEPDLLACAAS